MSEGMSDKERERLAKLGQQFQNADALWSDAYFGLLELSNQIVAAGRTLQSPDQAKKGEVQKAEKEGKEALTKMAAKLRELATKFQSAASAG